MAITAHGLGCTLDGVSIFDGIDLAVAAGELVVVTGEFGVGKSVLLRCLAGVEEHTGELGTTGSVRLVPAEPALSPGLTVSEHGDPADPAWVSLLDRWELTEHATKTPVMLSRGMATKVQLAQAVWAGPENYLLDEPLNGLDRRGRSLVVTLLAEVLAVGACVVVATHDHEAFPGAALLTLS